MCGETCRLVSLVFGGGGGQVAQIWALTFTLNWVPSPPPPLKHVRLC